MRHTVTPGDSPAANLRDPLFWPMTSLFRQTALDGMANRAKFEMHQVESGMDIVAAHGEAAASYEEYDWFLHGAKLFLRSIGHHLEGSAADLGSGTGVAACILSTFDRISEIFAVEYSEPFATHVMPLVFHRFGARMEKIQRVIGDFNAMRFADGALDLIVEINSFHHSEALGTTLRECSRVLRPGGILIAIDRAWPDSHTREQLESRLDRELPDDLKLKYGVPPSASFTRRDWGEHEYRISEWLTAFQQQGFDSAALIQGFPHVRGVNRVLPHIRTFQLSLVMAAIAYRLGKRRLSMYRFYNPEKVLFICTKRNPNRTQL